MFLRSLFGDGSGDITVSLAAVVFRESQEKGLVNFLDGGGGGC